MSSSLSLPFSIQLCFTSTFQHDHHLLLPLLRAPCTLSSSADTDEDEEDNETTTKRRRRRRTTTVTRFRSLALLWKTVRARSLSACWYRLPPRNDKLIYEAERTTMLFEQPGLAPTKCCLFSFTLPHSPFSFSFPHPSFSRILGGSRIGRGNERNESR